MKIECQHCGRNSQMPLNGDPAIHTCGHCKKPLIKPHVTVRCRDCSENNIVLKESEFSILKCSGCNKYLNDACLPKHILCPKCNNVWEEPVPGKVRCTKCKEQYQADENGYIVTDETHLIVHERENAVAPQDNINLTNEEKLETVLFFHGKVSLIKSGHKHTVFRIVDNGTLIQVCNSTHTRLIESMRYPKEFEIIAPYTPETGAVTEIIEGEMPDSCIKEYTLGYYQDLNSKYVAMQMKNRMKKLGRDGKIKQKNGGLSSLFGVKKTRKISANIVTAILEKDVTRESELVEIFFEEAFKELNKRKSENESKKLPYAIFKEMLGYCQGKEEYIVRIKGKFYYLPCYFFLDWDRYNQLLDYTIKCVKEVEVSEKSVRQGVATSVSTHIEGATLLASVSYSGHISTKDIIALGERLEDLDKIIDRDDIGSKVGVEDAQLFAQDNEEAIQQIIFSAEQGEDWAQTKLGLMYEKGDGVRLDYTEAARWFRKAAEQGNEVAQFAIGWYCDLGRGVPQDNDKAVMWYQKSAEQGFAMAQINLGYLYTVGCGVAKDYTKGVEWNRKAAEQGENIAQHNMGDACEKGQGVPQDDNEAIKWYQKAAEQGNASAQESLGNLYSKGRGVAQSDEEAFKWLRKAAEQGKDTAQFELGVMYTTGKGVLKDYVEATKWLRKAGDQNNLMAQGTMGMMNMLGLGLEKNYEEAASWFLRAAEQGQSVAQTYLGIMCENGQGIPQDYVKAYMWFDLAAAKGDEQALNCREKVAEKMTPPQVEEAQRLSQGWVSKNALS